MNDFDYDVMQKKRIARGARNRKCGSKSKRCAMSTDYMTNKELQGRNGEVVTYKMNKPIGWEDFKSLPIDLQREYLQGLVDRFCVSGETISNKLFGKSKSNLSIYLNKRGISISFLGHKTRSLFKEDEWTEWLRGEDAEEESAEDVPVACVEEVDEPVLAAQNPVEPTLFATTASICFEGELCKMTLYKMLESIPDMFGKVRINIAVESLGGK